MSFTRQRLILFLVPLFLSLPFINRAYFVDDNYFVEIATWLKDNPQLPYHFRTDDAGLQTRGWEENGFVRMVNPLLHHYYLALLLKAGGAKEWFVRLGCVFLSCFAALFIFGLARRLCDHPFWTTLLILLSPVFWLSAHSLLIDSTLGFFFFGSLYFFIRASEKDSLVLVILSGLFAGAAIVSKYPGLLILPICGVWLMLRWKKISRRWIYVVPFVMGLGTLAAYSIWTNDLYGAPHLLAASARMVNVPGLAKYFVFFVFLSGATLLPLVVWGVNDIRRNLVNGLAVFVLALVLSSKVGGFSVLQGGLLGLWFVTSLIFMAGFLRAKPLWVYPRDHFLFAWLFGFIILMFLVMDWVAARYYVIVVPAVGFMAARLLEFYRPALAQITMKRVAVMLLVFTGALAFSDYKQAAPSRDVVQKLREAGFSGGARHFYLGDSFTMSYLKAEGWVPCFPETVFQKGDWVLAKEITMPLVWFAHKPILIKQLARFDYPSSLPLKVMDYQGSAGFYASVWGALPFTFSTGPWERFRLFEIVDVKKEPL